MHAGCGRVVPFMMSFGPNRAAWSLLFALSVGLFLPQHRIGAQENLALGRPVESTGPNWGSFKPGALTDGDPATFTHPADDSGTEGFTYEVDLGATRRLERIVLRNRDDGCCPERLTRFRVEIWSDREGSPGQRRWMASVRSDGSHSGVAGTDTLLAALDPAGEFAGRFVRVVNASDAAYNPQLAEIEVYGGTAPEIRLFAPSLDVLEPGQSTVLRWNVLHATSVRVEPGVGGVSPVEGTVRVVPEITTTYTLVATNEHGVSRASVTIGVGVVLQPPRLTEFMADNPGGAGQLEDDDEASDWLELLNPNPYSLGLAGYYLTDDPSLQEKWLLPDIRIPPAGFLVVFASGKDRREVSRPLHTDFRLGATGDFLALLDRDGVTILDQFPPAGSGSALYPAQRSGVSYGRDAAGREGFMRPGTPGATNGPAWAGIVADTRFSQDRGLYDNPLRVEVTSSTPGAVIRYTTDRSLPTATRGTPYTGPISITSNTVLKAAAFRPDWAPTDVDTHTYVFPSNVIASASMRRSITTHATYGPQLPSALRDLPSVALATTATINGTTEVAGSMEWIPASNAVPGTTNSSGSLHSACGIRHFGGAFTDFAKKNFRLYFRSEYGASRLRAPLFEGFERGLAAVDTFDQLELRSGSHDMAMRGFYLGNAFTDDTLLEMGHLNPHGRFVHLYLNGAYWGVYHLRERWGAAMHRRYLGGETEDYESINGNWNVGGWAEPGVPYDGDGSTWARVKALRSDYPAIQSWLNVPQFVDFMLMWMFGGAEDEYRCVGPKTPGSGFQFYLNDADGWFCIPAYCAADDRTGRGAPGRRAGDGPGSVFSMLHASGNADYRTLLADHIQRALTGEGALTPSKNRERLLRRSTEFERPFLAESARWGYLTPVEWAARRDSALNTWLPRRTSEALAQFQSAGFLPRIPAPVPNRAGGDVPSGFEVNFATPASGTILFTRDGSDPRLPDGAISPAAERLSVGNGPSRTPEVLLPAGSSWRWFTDAAGLGSSAVVPGHPSWAATNWKHPAFDDSAWSAGNAQLGYGEGDEATTLPFGPASSKWITIYFRRAVVVSELKDFASTSLRLKSDDGAILYLNGVEVLRHSMPEGPVGGNTLANPSPDDGQGFVAFPVPASALLPGTNWVAVELHQSAPTSSDASFDLEWRAEVPVVPGPTAFRVLQNTQLKARVWSANEWSALTEAFYRVGTEAVAPGDLVIRELAYHPSGTNGVEFLELENVSGRAIDLRGCRFVEGVTYAFSESRSQVLAPGQRWVLVQELFRFRRQYGLGPWVGGVFSGQLNNAGEVLHLVDRAGRTLVRFQFGDDWPWPQEADGGGFTLVLARPELGMDRPEAWRLSALPDGTPGTSDASRFVGDPGEDSDGDGLSAIVEYALGTDDRNPDSGHDGVEAGVDATGWFVIRIRRQAAADDVALRVEASTDLTVWVPAVWRGGAVLPPGVWTETWGISANPAGSAFLRLAVVRRP
jgi:hypothetical protein